MCLIHSVGNSARGSSQCWHAAVQNFLLRICFRPLWNKFKAKRFRKTGRNICTAPQRSFLKTSKSSWTVVGPNIALAVAVDPGPLGQIAHPSGTKAHCSKRVMAAESQEAQHGHVPGRPNQRWKKTSHDGGIPEEVEVTASHGPVFLHVSVIHLQI